MPDEEEAEGEDEEEGEDEGEDEGGGKAQAAAQPAACALEGKVLVFTGKLTMSRADAKRLAEEAGATVKGGVSGTTDILVAGPGSGSKVSAAQAKGVDVWDEATFQVRQSASRSRCVVVPVCLDPLCLPDASTRYEYLLCCIVEKRAVQSGWTGDEHRLLWRVGAARARTRRRTRTRRRRTKRSATEASVLATMSLNALAGLGAFARRVSVSATAEAGAVAAMKHAWRR